MALDTKNLDQTVADSRAWDVAMRAASQATTQSNQETTFTLALHQQKMGLSKQIANGVEQNARKS